jgi:uncharacterized membrane protein
MLGAEVTAGVRWMKILRARPRLMVSTLVGVVVAVALAALEPTWSPATTFIVAWDVLCLVFLASAFAMMRGVGPDEIRAHSAAQDEGRHAILTIVLCAAAISLWAIGLQLSDARSEHGLLRTGHVALAFVTVALSWTMVQVMFALHYAHDYYEENEDCVGHDMKGLDFPGGELPDYWDFVHFSMIIGVAAQTADIAFTSKTLRRIGTVHSLVAFAFNTIVVALTINLLAGLF